jgi:hypothetical protein
MKHPKSLKVVFAALAVSMVPLFGSCGSGADSDDSIQQITAVELARVLDVQKGSWALPEIPDPSWLHVQLWKDGEYRTGSSASHAAESLRGEEVMPFYVRRYYDEGEPVFAINGNGGRTEFRLSHHCGQNYFMTSGYPTGPITVGPDGVIFKLDIKEEDDSHHEIVLRFAIKETGDLGPTEGEAR